MTIRMGLATVAEREAAGLRLSPISGVFGEEDYAGLPDAARRYLRSAIAPGTPRSMAVRLAMRGKIRIEERWLPFRAHEVLAPHDGFVWAARVGGVIWGTDSFVAGRGSTTFSVLGAVPVARASGPDVDRSAAGRAVAEAVWAPTSLLPLAGATYAGSEPGVIRVRLEVAGHEHELVLETYASSGQLRRAHLLRWGDPDESGAFDWHPFGVEVTGYAQVAGLTVPAAGRVGWYPGEDRFATGEFFRFRLTGLWPMGEEQVI